MSNPATNWSESVSPDEVALFDRFANELRMIQRDRAKKNPVGRALHYKPHGGFLGEFETLADLPEWTRVGIFASPGKYPAYARYSAGAGTAQHDRNGDVRGFAVKVAGVPGKKLIPGLESAKTQDFLAILTPAMPVRTPTEFVGLVRAISGSPLLALPRLIGALGGRTFAVLSAAKKNMVPIDSVATQTFFSALPIKWGTTAVKFSWAPRAGNDGASTADGKAWDRYALDIAARLAKSSLEYDLRIQGFVDDTRTPIEDPTRVWSETDAPWITVGRLTVPRQDVASDRAKKIAAHIEKLSFDPWHAPEDFRPLGAMMRARAAAYRDSVTERQVAPEPDGTETW